MPPMLNFPRRVRMPETKPAIKSSVLWGLAAIAVPYITQACQYLGTLPAGTLPLPVAYAIAGVGWVTAAYGRLYGSNKPISGILTTKE